MKQIQMVLKSYSKLTTPPRSSDFELSIEEIFESIKRRYSHENEEQHKIRLTKMYEEQFSRVLKCPIYIYSSGESDDSVKIESTPENLP